MNRSEAHPPAFHLLAKPTGAICNLDCSYCFFLSKELLYPGSRFRMANEMLESYLRQIIEAHAAEREVVIAWQGGEPTMMGLDFFRRSVEIAEKLRLPHQVLTYTIQTNGTLIDERWATFFKEAGFLVGLSIDGPELIHDTYRVDSRGEGSFRRVLRGHEALASAGVDWNALTTVHAANEAHGVEIYRFLSDDLGARHLQFIPIVERSTSEMLEISNAGWNSRDGRSLYTQRGEKVTERSVSPSGYGRFLIEVFEEWLRGDVGEVFVQMFDVALANFAGEPPGLCVHSETCGRALALEHNGDLYSCDHFVEPAHLLGNIAETTMVELVSSPKQRAFGEAKRDALPAYCRSCELRFACHGGCPKDRFALTDDGERGLNYLCPSYKAFFSHIAPVMQEMRNLLSVGRAPADVTIGVLASDAARGRNDSCPCNSGRSWKRCHGASRRSAR